jgi:2-succinyl-5-enolpyruvyl-6-hydroxy-3-cyclohexene-1-carboxylate synthase
MTNVERAHEVIAEVRARGVRDFCVCAGSRNSPLLAALSTIHDLHLYSFVDERAAAYFALGRAKRDGLPVAVVTTSGTAVAELLPAAIEAHYSGVPLVLITADRPARFRGTGAPQAIEQEGIFGVYATKSVTHINIEFDEPLLDEVADGVAGLRGYEVAGGANRDVPGTPEPRNPATSKPNSATSQPRNPATSQRNLATSQPRNLVKQPRNPIPQPRNLVTQLQFRKPLVLLGGLQAEERDAVLKFVTAYGAAVYAEPLSGLREERALASQVVLNERMLTRGGFDGVIRIGDVPTLRFWRDLDEKYPGVPVVHFSRMPFAGLARGEVYSIEELPPAPPAVKRDDDYIARDRTRAEEVAAILDREPQSEQGLVRALSRELPVSSRIFLGNSLPVREWDLAATREPRGFAIEANRGANGIDGQLSTFFGWCKPRVENVCIVGDLTALYDLNAPWACPQLNRGVRFRIIIINNGGGRIFSRVASLQPLDSAFRERVIENEHTLRFDDWAAMWKIDYEWGGVVTPMSSEAGMRLVTELVPDPDATKRAWDAYDELWR